MPRCLVVVLVLSFAVRLWAEPQVPLVQTLVPGFEVIELPVQLPNLNNLRYRSDGALYALGYNGNVWLLRDTDGDGLEDSSHVFFENQAQLRGPIGMAVIPSGHALLHREGELQRAAQGVIVASKGKVSALIDWNGDDRVESEQVIASGWQEIPQNVDAIGVAVSPQDGSIYFGLGTAAFNNAYLIDEQGASHFDRNSVRGTIQRIAPDLLTRETICTGVRFTIGMQFDQHGELFVTEQEGATWLPNGNPFDELLHIRRGRHYGFPPRHPRHLPHVFDEPSLYDYRPQHQSTCGFFLNLPPVAGAPIFGPASWRGDAFVTGQSRGKLYRTRLVRTSSGEYLAANQILACLGMLTVDCTLTPRGQMLVCCHSGGPDWGTGPSGEGKLFLVRERATTAPRPTVAWSSGPQEVRIAFASPLDATALRGLAREVRIQAGSYVAAGDRFETLRPGYEVVQRQFATAPRDVEVYAASIAADQRTLVLATDRLTEAVGYAVQLPGMGREREIAAPHALVQDPGIDVDFSLSGWQAEWLPLASEIPSPAVETTYARWSGAVCHPNPHYNTAFWMQVPEAVAYSERTSQSGTLTLRTRIDTTGLFLPATQPGSSLDYASTEDRWITATKLRMKSTVPLQATFRGRSHRSVADADTQVIELDWDEGAEALPLLVLELATGTPLLAIEVEWVAEFEDGTSRSGPLALHRFLLPWASPRAPSSMLPARNTIPELAGADWRGGREIFHSKHVQCHRCHVAHGEGGTLGPDLSNLVHRDYESVLRDIRQPSFAINPDYVTYVVHTSSGRVLTGAVQNDGDQVHIGDSEGNVTTVRRDEIEALRPSPTSVMPDGLVDKLDAAQLRDLMAYLLTPQGQP